MPPPWTGVTTWLRRKTLPDGGKGRWTSSEGRIVWSTHLGSNEPAYDTDNPILRSSQLRTSGLEENTLIDILSDNGGPTKELTSSNAPLRGGKGELSEGGIRVPFILSWKGQVPAAQVYDAPVTSMDVTAAAFAAAGVATRPAELDGLDLLPLLERTPAASRHTTLFWRVGKKNALRHKDWKLIRDGGAWQLFDLTNDVSETTNLAAKEPARVAELSVLWDQWNSEQIEPLWRSGNE